MQTFTIFIQGIIAGTDIQPILRQLMEAQDANITHVWIYKSRNQAPFLVTIEHAVESLAEIALKVTG